MAIADDWAILEDYTSTETLKHDITTDAVTYILCAEEPQWGELFNDALVHFVIQWRHPHHSTNVKELPPTSLEALHEESFHLYESVEGTDRELHKLWECSAVSQGRCP